MNTRVCVRVCVFFVRRNSPVLSKGWLQISPGNRDAATAVTELTASRHRTRIGVGIRDAATAVRSVRVIKITVGTAMVAFIKALLCIEQENGLIEEVDQILPGERCCSSAKPGCVHFNLK